MPQFIQEITSVSHSLLCCLKMNWWAQKHRNKDADCSSVLMGKQKVVPKEFMMQQVLMDDSRKPENPEGIAVGGFLSLLKSHSLFQKRGFL